MKRTHNRADSLGMTGDGRSLKASLIALCVAAIALVGVAISVHNLDNDPVVSFWAATKAATQDSWNGLTLAQRDSVCATWDEHRDLVLDRMVARSTLPASRPDSISDESVKDFYSNFLYRVCGAK